MGFDMKIIILRILFVIIVFPMIIPIIVYEIIGDTTILKVVCVLNLILFAYVLFTSETNEPTDPDHFN